MSKKVTAYEAIDGTLHKTKLLADIHSKDTKVRLRILFDECHDIFPNDGLTNELIDIDDLLKFFYNNRLKFYNILKDDELIKTGEES